MRRLFIFALAFSFLSAINADTTTSRLSLTKPDQSSTGWGTKLNLNWDLVDAGVACLACTNAFTGTNSFTSLSVRTGNGFFLYNVNNTAAALFSNPGSSGQSQLTVTALDDIGINNSPIPGVTMSVYGDNINGISYGTFAVVGSSANGTGAYSGFTVTSPITTSTLWSLPPVDGIAGNFLRTDGSNHLSFSNTLIAPSTAPVIVSNRTSPVLDIDLNQANSPAGEIHWSVLGTTNAVVGWTGAGGFSIQVSTQSTASKVVDRINISQGASPQITLTGQVNVSTIAATGGFTAPSSTITWIGGTTSSFTTVNANKITLTSTLTTGATTGILGEVLVSSGPSVNPYWAFQGIIQSSQCTSITPTATTSSAYGATALTCTIVPRGTGNKIRVTFTADAQVANASNAAIMTIARGGSNILGAGGCTDFFPNAAATTRGAVGCVYQDTTTTTSGTALTYSVQVKNSDNVNTVKFISDAQPQATMILDEIGPNP